MAMETIADQMLYSVELADTVYESSGSVHDSLEPIELVLWSTGQQTVTIYVLIEIHINSCFNADVFFLIFSAPSLRGSLVERHQILTHVRRWSYNLYYKFGQKFGDSSPKKFSSPKTSNFGPNSGQLEIFIQLPMQLWQTRNLCHIKCDHPACVSSDDGYLSIWWFARLIWHNFIKVAGNWIKICSPA